MYIRVAMVCNLMGLTLRNVLIQQWNPTLGWELQHGASQAQAQAYVWCSGVEGIPLVVSTLTHLQ
jgi:hypothetical protein